MDQLSLSLLGRLDAPSVAPAQYVGACKTYREAVRMAYALRRVKNLTLRSLAEQAGLPPQHVSDYLNKDDGKRRRDLPADRISSFEAVVGNSCVSQWLAAQAKLTILEEMTATARAAA